MSLKTYLFSTPVGTALLLSGVMVLFGLPTWAPLIRKRSDPYTIYRFALYSTALSQVVQAYFIWGVNTNLLPMTYSLRYGAVGLPLCFIGAGFACLSLVSDRRGAGCLITVTFTGLLWLILITFH